MAITYLKKAVKTPQTGTDKTRKIVTDMLTKIEAGGEAAALAYGQDLDGYNGDAIVSLEMIENAGKTGKIGDGKIFISDLSEVIRIRTGETGDEAL